MRSTPLPVIFQHVLEVRFSRNQLAACAFVVCACAPPSPGAQPAAATSPQASAREPVPGTKGLLVDARAFPLPHYVVDASNPEQLQVRVTLPALESTLLRVGDGGERFVIDARERTPEGTWSLERGPDGFLTQHCQRGCEVTYGFGLREAARQLRDAEGAEQFGEAIVSPSSSWLLGVPRRVGYSLEVATRAPVSFLTALPPVRESSPELVGTTESPPIFAPFAGLGAWRTRKLRVSDAEITVGIAGEGYATTDDELLAWLRQTLEPMADYYSGLPGLRPLILVVPGQRRIHGVTLGNGGSSVLLRVGPEVTAEQALAAWVPTHELVHVLYPSVAPRLPWIEEGLATYVEPIVRLRAGRVSVERFWRELVLGLPQGLPKAGDRGLDRTPTWGRTYWGGASFWLLVDVRIRERTHNRRSVREALSAILHAGGNVSEDWPLERILSVADAATQGREFHDAYAQMGEAAWAPDLGQLWADLGVAVSGERVVFDAGARLASVRAGITSDALH